MDALLVQHTTSKMYLLSSISFLAILFGLPLDASAGCMFLAYGSIPFRSCLLNKYMHINVDGRRVQAGVDVEKRIQLEQPSRKVLVSCGTEHTVLRWPRKKDANQARVRYIEGRIVIRIFWCDSFDGPKQAGIRCAIEAFASACPGRVGINNHTCVYEVVTSRFSSNTVRKATEVKTEVAVIVRKKANVAVGVLHTKERTVVNAYTVNSHSYIVIPAGYAFCSFSAVKSIEEYLAPTGFTWQCQLPTFVQTRRIGRCSELPLCKNQTPCPGSNNHLPDENISVAARPVAMLIVLCMVVLNIIV